VWSDAERKYRKRRRLSFKNKLRSTWFELYPLESCAREGNGQIQGRISQSFRCNEERTSYFMDAFVTLADKQCNLCLALTGDRFMYMIPCLIAVKCNLVGVTNMIDTIFFYILLSGLVAKY
jgi:hypothetical protein